MIFQTLIVTITKAVKTMKNVGYYFAIVIESLALLITIVLPFACPVLYADCWAMLLSVILGVPLLALVVLGVDYRNNNAFQKETEKLVIEEKPLEVVEQDDSQTIPKSEVEEDSKPKIEECLEQKWSKAMYQRYCALWDDLFKHMKRPLVQEDKARISLMLWEISSMTISFLKESNSDPNSVWYDEDSVKMIMENLSQSDIKLEKFRIDPNTIDENAIAVFEWLKEQGVNEDTTAFGYQLKF